MWLSSPAARTGHFLKGIWLAMKKDRILVRLRWVYPLVMTDIAMEDHHFSWENSLFQWPFSIAMFNFQSLYVCGRKASLFLCCFFIVHECETFRLRHARHEPGSFAPFGQQSFGNGRFWHGMWPTKLPFHHGFRKCRVAPSRRMIATKGQGCFLFLSFYSNNWAPGGMITS